MSAFAMRASLLASASKTPLSSSRRMASTAMSALKKAFGNRAFGSHDELYRFSIENVRYFIIVQAQSASALVVYLYIYVVKLYNFGGLFRIVTMVGLGSVP
jgi:hypothetical protein